MTFDGGEGFDVVTHTGATALSLTLGGTGTQGAATKSYTAIEGVVGALGNDTMTGSRGDNLMVGGNGSDRVAGGQGDDFLIGEGRGSSFISAYMGLNINFSVADAFDPLNGNVSGTYSEDDGLSDSLFGGIGDDVLSGGAGADLLDGGTGKDWVTYLSSPDFANIVLNLSTGGIAGDAAGDQFVSIENVLGSNANDTITGNDGANDLRGMYGQDSLSGLDGRDILDGGRGRDTLAGGRDRDVLTGGGDAEDAFVFGGPGTLVSVDAITDFQVNFDEIWLSGGTFRKVGALGELSADRFVLGSTAHDRDDRILYDAATGALSYDADGNRAGAAVQFAQLANGLALTAADFVITA